MCDVCKAELGYDTKIVLLDDIIDDDEPLKLCPICKTAYISMDEEMCETCLASEKRNRDSSLDDDDEWRTYLDDDDTGDTTGDDTIPLEDLDDDYDDGDDFDDEENYDLDLDDYPDDIATDLDLDDFDDDDDDEDDLDDED